MKGCHSGLFWNELFPQLVKKERVPLSKFFGGTRLGVDMGSWLRAESDFFTEAVSALSTPGRTVYTPRRLMDALQLRHQKLVEACVAPVYVFPGAPNPMEVYNEKDLAVHDNIEKYLANTAAAAAPQQEHGQEPQPPESQYAVKMSVKEQRSQMKVNLRRSRILDPGLIAFLGEWMRTTGNMEVVNAPFETTWQLLDMERTDETQGTITEDGTLVMAGARLVLFNGHYPPDKFTGFRVYNRDKFMDVSTRSKLNKHKWPTLTEHPDHLPEAGTLYGTRYWLRKKLHGVGDIMRLHFPMAVARARGEPMTPGNPETIAVFNQAVNQMRYGPVARIDNDGNCVVEPLEKWPDDTLAWRDVLGFDPHQTLAMDPKDYYAARNFEDGLSFTRATAPRKAWFSNLTCANTRWEDEVEDEDGWESRAEKQAKKQAKKEAKKQSSVDW
jgi:hypothetical protein